MGFKTHCSWQGLPHKAASFTDGASGRDPKIELKFGGNAVGNPDAQQPGIHYIPNPLGGRIVDCGRADVTKTAAPKSAKPGQQVTYRNYNWTPAA